MARKSAPKPADHKANDAATAATNEANAVSAEAGTTDTQEGEKVSEVAGAPNEVPAANAPEPAGGEEGTGLSAATAAEDARLTHIIAGLSTEPAPILPEFAWTVVCHRDGGRRRAGRHWPVGETPVRADELTEYDLVQLQGDPQFSVIAIEQV